MTIRYTIQNYFSTFLFLFLIGALSNASAHQTEVQLPASKYTLADILHSNVENLSTDIGKNFEGWNTIGSSYEALPHFAFGKPVRIDGYNDITKSNAAEAAKAFLNQNKILDIDTESLILKRVTKVNNLWTVGYAQKFNNIEVLLSSVQIMIRSDAKVISFERDYYSNIDAPTTPTVSVATAIERAGEFNTEIKNRERIQANKELFIIPVHTPGNVDFRLVYDITIAGSDLITQTFVDANSSALVWKRELTSNIDTKVKIAGMVKMNNPLNEEMIKPFYDINVLYNDSTYITDMNGEVVLPVEAISDFSVSFTGPYANVSRLGSEKTTFTKKIEPGVDFEMEISDTNSHLFERMLFYHTNKAHKFYTDIDPESSAMDFQINVTLRSQGMSPNASSNLETGDINFYKVDDPAAKMAQTPGILYHEYGHSVNTRLYKELGCSNGMINFATHEATADLNAALQLNDPRIGYGTFPDTNKIIRTINNNNKYPDDISGESHHDGLILAGAFWDMKKVINDLNYMAKLIHYSKKISLPDDENTGVAYAEWLLAALIADDALGEGDNDLTNGSPNAMEILEAFNKHQIGPRLLVQSTFSHDPYPDTYDTENNYVINFHLDGSIAFLENTPSNVMLHYSINGGEYIDAPAEMLTKGNYEVIIPAQPRGTKVRYYFTAVESYSKAKMEFFKNMQSSTPYLFYVGYKTVFTDNLEEIEGWTIGADSDNSTNAGWEYGVPSMVVFKSGNTKYTMQPGEDHSSDGTKCFVTGAGFDGTTSGFYTGMPNGKTTLTSPKYDISNLSKPLLTYYQYFVNIQYFGPNHLCNWITEISSDGGITWVTVENTKEFDWKWIEKKIDIEEYIELTKEFQFRIIFNAKKGQNIIPGAWNEGLVDDIGFLTANDGLVSSKQDEIYENIVIFPNPASDFITVGNIYEKIISKIEISDMNGITIHSISGISGDELKIDLNKFSTGMYVLKLYSETDVKTHKFVIIR